MARSWRIEYEGAYYHILSRGNEGRDIFYGDEDKRLFLDTVGGMSDQFDIDVFAYVLMSNHYHLLFRTNLANLSRAMQWLGLSYTRRFNNRVMAAVVIFSRGVSRAFLWKMSPMQWSFPAIFTEILFVLGW